MDSVILGREVSIPFTLHFEWDPSKARQNRKKHRVGFEEAVAVFADSMALTVYDKEHSESEDRWITLGRVQDEDLLVVVHTYREIGAEEAVVRIISARRPTKKERQEYEEAP